MLHTKSAGSGLCAKLDQPDTLVTLVVNQLRAQGESARL